MKKDVDPRKPFGTIVIGLIVLMIFLGATLVFLLQKDYDKQTHVIMLVSFAVAFLILCAITIFFLYQYSKARVAYDDKYTVPVF